MDELKVVMEAIGGDKFEAMASKMALLDQTLLDRTSMLSDMFGKNSNELRDRMLQHERSFAELYGKLTALERTAQESVPRHAALAALALRFQTQLVGSLMSLRAVRTGSSFGTRALTSRPGAFGTVWRRSWRR